MNNSVFSSILIIIVLLGTFGNSFGYKWESIDFSDSEVSLDAVHVYKSNTRYVGRAKHFGKVLPAEITENPIECLITFCNKLVTKHECEILVEDDTDTCHWYPYSSEDSDENSVRLGTNSLDNEPTYLGATKTDKKYHVTGIYLTSEAAHSWIGSDPKDIQYYYQCEPRAIWIDVPSNGQLPNYSLPGLVMDNGQKIYVARLEHDCMVLTGQVISGSNTASALSYEGEPIESSNYQVIVGDGSDFAWMPASNGQIPDYAVVQGKNVYELAYVALFSNNTIGHITNKQAHKLNLEYKILVYNYL